MAKVRGPRPAETTLFGTVGCTLTPEQRGKLRRIAIARNVSMSLIARTVVGEWIAQQEDPGDGDNG